MKNIKKEELDKLRLEFRPGTRVQLDRMEDIQAPPIGTQGTVQCVDDIGSIHVSWDNGCGLAVLHQEDKCTIIQDNQ